MNTLVCL